ncbi:DNA methyltransferase [Rhodoluna sp.]|uniref:Eco57I restriction-modification methylase domain-containing protein n=1 Tax=Rhodoluna sp. TaxID=1969481 RepID=UPI0025E22899|nr:DNA methyltransferase [Rhodoluna sp.]
MAITNLNDKLQQLSYGPDLDLGLQISLDILGLLGVADAPQSSDVVDGRLLKLPNSERQDPWFQQHPWMRGERSAFELVDSSAMPLQAKFYWLKKKGTAFVAGAVHFTKNWEDHDFTRTVDFKVGVDFFLSPSGQSITVVLSNRGRLRVLELEKKLTNTQVEIFEKWTTVEGSTNHEALHTLLWESFKLQTVNSFFYAGVSDAFNELVAHLVILGKDPEEAKLFTSRLLGRLIFLWFLRKMDLVSQSQEYFEADSMESSEYYRLKLEPLFFGTLNTPVENRANQGGIIDLDTPYLNGGLFSPREDDWVADTSVTFPAFYFTRLYAHFSQFNFTTDESTPEFEQVAIDPEMLGRVFESLLASQIESTGEQGRKAKGAYYTPRAVVAYMVKETVRQYLLTKLGADGRSEIVVSKLLDTSDQDWAIAGSNSVRDIPADMRKSIVEHLGSMKTIDPACGSGAFPLGLLHLLAKIHHRLDPKLDTYTAKLSILQNNIFGIDIEPMAVEISRLRSWLSLIVEEGGSKAVQPLPNLEFNFVAANSLVPLDGEGLLSDEKLIAQLSKLRTEYFKANTPTKKNKLQSDYQSLIEPSLFDEFDERSKQLKTFNPFSPHAVAEFFDAEHIFGLEGGFDVVIGNPPYLSEKGHGETFRPVRYSQIGKRFYVGKMDYFYFFFHGGLDLLKEGGVLSFITTNYFTTATYANKLRADLAQRTSPKIILNFGELKIFESAAGQHNMITLVSKDESHGDCKTLVARTDKDSKATEDFLDGVFSQNPDFVEVQNIHFDDLFTNNQIRLTNAESHAIESVLNVVAACSHTLGLHFNAQQGAQTQADRVSKAHIRKFGLPEEHLGRGIFVLSPDELSKLSLDEHESAIVKPWFKNSDIRRYKLNTNNSEVVLFADKRQQTLESRPKVLEHLNLYRQIIDAASSNSPYMHRPRSINYEVPKIVTPYKTPGVRFSMAEGPWYGSGDIYFITERNSEISLWALLGILNSELLNAWYWQRGKRKGNLIEMYEEPLSATPIPAPTSANREIFKRIAELAKQNHRFAMTDDVRGMEACDEELNKLVAELYGLTDKQNLVLSEWTKAWVSTVSNNGDSDLEALE